MEIKKISKKKNNLYQILLSDNTSLSFYDDTIIKYNLLVNRSFDDKTLQEMLAFNNESAAYYKALSYIKAKLRTKKEIEDKLKKLGYTNNVVLNTIKRLEKQKYLNDDIYIKAYISDQVNLTLKGPKKISQELIKLGFKEEIVNTYIDKYSNDLWEEKIIKIINKKIKSNHNLSKKMLINKIKSDLINLGYNLEMINKLLLNIDYQNDEEILNKEINKAIKKCSKKYQGKDLELKVKMYLYSKGFDYNIDINNYL